MEIGGESKGEVGQDSTWGGGVNVLGRWSARDEAPEETSRNGGGETEEESEDWDRHPNRRRHCLHLHLHCCSSLSLSICESNPPPWFFWSVVRIKVRIYRMCVYKLDRTKKTKNKNKDKTKGMNEKFDFNISLGLGGLWWGIMWTAQLYGAYLRNSDTVIIV